MSEVFIFYSFLKVLGSTILQQTFIVEYLVQGQMCDDCHRREAKDFWKAVVQVRQKVKKNIIIYQAFTGRKCLACDHRTP